MENIDLKAFNDSCDEFIEGKYILADVKISKILKSITYNEKVKNIILSCVENYNFEEALENAKQEDISILRIILPTEEKELVAFIFNLLYYFNNKQLDFYDFISKYYKNLDEENGKEFYNFAEMVITPFKNAVDSLFSKRHILVNDDDYHNNKYNQIMQTVKLILKNMDNYKLRVSEKEEFTMLLSSLYTASEKNDKKLVFSLIIGIEYFSLAHRKCKEAYLALQDCFS